MVFMRMFLVIVSAVAAFVMMLMLMRMFPMIVSTVAAFVMMLMLMRVFLMIVLAAAAFVCESRSVMFGNSAFSFCNDNIRFQTVCDFLYLWK